MQNAKTENHCLTAIIGNLCLQIIAFQQAISGRAELPFPDAKEIANLCKLVNCLDKLEKLSAGYHHQKLLRSFTSFINKKEKGLGTKISGMLQDYLSESSPDSLTTPPSPDNTALNNTAPALFPAPNSLAPALFPALNSPASKSSDFPFPGNLVPKKIPTPIDLMPDVFTLVHAPLPHEILPAPAPAGANKRENKKPPVFVPAPYDPYLTRKDVEQYPLSFNDYNEHWDFINGEYNPEQLVENREKVGALQYKLRFIHYTLQLREWEKNNF